MKLKPIVLSAVVCIAVNTFAQENKKDKVRTDTLSVKKLEEVVVVGSIGVTKVAPQVIKYQTKDLASQNGGTAGDILKAMPSVAMGGSPNHNRDIRFRGLGNGYTQVLINGKPIGVSGNNRESVLDMIPANQIESIEIMSNPTADVVSSGINGVVNIILKKDAKTIPKDKYFKGTTTFGVDNNKGYNGSIGINTRVKDWEIGISYDRLHRRVNNDSKGTIQIFDNTKKLKESQAKNKLEDKFFKNESAKIYLSKTFSNHWSLNLDMLFGKQIEEKTKAESNVVFDTKNAYVASKSKHTTSPETKTVQFYTPSFSLTKDWQNSRLNLGYGINRSTEDKRATNSEVRADANGNPIFSTIPKYTSNTDDITMTTHLPTLSYEMKIGKSTIKTGYQGFFTKRTSEKINSEYKTNEWVVHPDNKNNFQANEDINAFFATYQVSFHHVTINAGYRHELATIRSKSSNQTQWTTGAYSTALPSLHVKYNILEKTYIATSVGRRVRRPGFNDLNPFVEIKSVTEQKTGNPDLQPETAWAYEFGAFSQIKKINFGVNFFQRDISNLIQKNIVERNGIFLETSTNIGSATSRGIELITATNPFHWLSLNANYSKFWSKINTAGEFKGDQLKDQFQWTAKLLADFKLPYKIELQCISSWVGPKNTVQEGEGKLWYMDMGIQKEFGKNNFVYLRCSDVLNTVEKTKFKNTTTQIENTLESTLGQIITIGTRINF